ncbi:MAG: hypothetical protein M1383_06135 [Patescibacteria group bacterium]|nr:hypothetical protein [Patescibacteria group bacterium]
MKYKKFIEDNFLIDEPELGKLIPFKFNKVQSKYYDILCKECDIEKKGVGAALRELDLKARREGMSSFILALFAADDMTNENPTESEVISYKDDATKKFRKRYRNYILSCYAKRAGVAYEDIIKNPDVLEQFAKSAFLVDSNELELRENRAHFFCGTASARTGERGGTLQKLLLSEAAWYPDTENMTAEEIIEGTMRQIDIKSGWIFIETTGNGKGNHYYKMWEKAVKKLSRFKPRFFGWRDFYTEEEFEIIKSEFVDMSMLKQEYPETADDAFQATSSSFTDEVSLAQLIENEKSPKELVDWISFQGTNYIEQCELIKDWLQGLEMNAKHYNLYVGIDVAKSMDQTVVTVLKLRQGFQKGGIQQICIDSTGAGDFMPDWFDLNTRWQVTGIKFTAQMKDILYRSLQAIIAKKLTALPQIRVDDMVFVTEAHENFWEQMLYLEKEIVGRILVVKHPGQNNSNRKESSAWDNRDHDDYPDSWVLAEHAYVVVHGLPAKEDTKQIQPNKSIVANLLNNKDPRQHSRTGDSE